jgi:hypothetical protein
MTNLLKYEHIKYENSDFMSQDCVARIFLPRAIYENIDIVFIEGAPY